MTGLIVDRGSNISKVNHSLKILTIEFSIGAGAVPSFSHSSSVKIDAVLFNESDLIGTPLIPGSPPIKILPIVFSQDYLIDMGIDQSEG